jgi:hypothetical protein
MTKAFQVATRKIRVMLRKNPETSGIARVTPQIQHIVQCFNSLNIMIAVTLHNYAFPGQHWTVLPSQLLPPTWQLVPRNVLPILILMGLNKTDRVSPRLHHYTTCLDGGASHHIKATCPDSAPSCFVKTPWSCPELSWPLLAVRPQNYFFCPERDQGFTERSRVIPWSAHFFRPGTGPYPNGCKQPSAWILFHIRPRGKSRTTYS